MAWFGIGNNPVDTKVPTVDLNREMKEKLKGELTEEVARTALGAFFKHNIGFTTELLTGKILEPYQRIVVKGWMQKNFSLTVAARSFGKSTICSHFCYLYCLFNPGRHILVCAATFRSSRQIVERVDEWARSKRGRLLKEAIQPLPNKGTMTKRQDLIRVTFKNGSTITAVPLGDPDNLRGFRCNVLIIDEGRLIPQNTINLVLKPFLAGGSDPTQKQKIRRKEKRLIAEGKMEQGEQVRFKADSKMIVMSSASYKWEELAEMYRRYRGIIESSDDEKKGKAEQHEGGLSSYLVHQMSYEITAPHLMDAGILEEIREKRIPQSVIDLEYRAMFIDESGGFFSAKQMAEATVPPGERPCIEIVGEKGAEYVLGIDPAGGAIGADPAGDHFAMCVLKVLTRKDGRKIGMVVHQYACAGVDLKHHIAYLYYLLSRFNIVYIVVDSSGGSIIEFIKTCNESEVFKHGKMELNSIDAEFAKEDWEETIKAVKKSYNPDSSLRRIVHNQFFSTPIIKAGNDHLRACFEQKTVMFASHSQSVPHAVEQMCQADIMGINNTHPEYHDDDLEGSSSMWDFCAYQDQLIELVKKECALIEVTSSPLGNLVYGLPHHMTRNRKLVSRVRKDSYSALWLAAWGLKVLTAAMEMPEQESDDTFTPMLIG
jgi:hypothetical protein